LLNPMDRVSSMGILSQLVLDGGKLKRSNFS